MNKEQFWNSVSKNKKNYSKFNKLENKDLTLENFIDYFSSLFSHNIDNTTEQSKIKETVESHFENI